MDAESKLVARIARAFPKKGKGRRDPRLRLGIGDDAAVIASGGKSDWVLSSDAFLEGVLLLRDAIGKEKRPLSWVIGPQGVQRPDMPSMRDAKWAQRQSLTVLRTPDSV